jgi:putative peptidoglycan lipid II flippase
MNQFFSKGKKILFSAQSSVLSAATLIMIMIIASSILGLIRQRVLAYFFAPGQLSLFFAAFRLPDTIFEVLVYGTFSSSFIPVFTRLLKKENNQAWQVAATVAKIGLLVYAVFVTIMFFLANPVYSVLAPGFSPVERAKIVWMARVLFISEGFFVVSYILTGVLESLKRFLVPALAPLFYNLGIISGTIIFSGRFGLMAPAIGVFMGAAMHFLVQFPLATKLGFRFSHKLEITEEVKSVGKLAAPRVIELSVSQVVEGVQLFLSSLISKAAYTYFTFGNTLQVFPITLFGTSIAKAALPTLSRQTDSLGEFRKTLFKALYQMSFAVLPIATTLAVLRIPIVRLVYGTNIFTWESTVQTGMVLSAFAFGIIFQAIAGLFARGFYALHDTRTPVAISISSMILNIILDFIFVKGFSFPTWGLALGFSLGNALQATLLYLFMTKRIDGHSQLTSLKPIGKTIVSTIFSGSAMYFLLKIFDRSAWVKKLSFLGSDVAKNIPFEKFVLDTQYTVNLLVLTIFVCAIGALVYIFISLILRNEELWDFGRLVGKLYTKGLGIAIPAKESEPVVPTPTDTASS